MDYLTKLTIMSEENPDLFPFYVLQGSLLILC